MASKIDPKRIRIDCDTQSRIEMNEPVIAEYAEAMERGDEFPAILVFFDEETDEFILVDGFHRYFAHMRAKPNDPILAEQRIGTVEDARWESLAANKSHGLRRSNADKRNTVKQALLHPKGVNLSDRQIAKHVGVDHKTISTVRRENEVTGEIPQSTLRTGLDGRTINTKNIGTKPAEEENSSTESCSNCLNFMNSRGECMLDSSMRKPWSDACEQFEELPPEPTRRELENIPDFPDEYEEVELNKGPKKKNPVRYKPRNTTCVDLPIDNPQMFAAELRSVFSDAYLEECFIAVRTLSRTSHDDDPFPNL